MAKTYNGVQAGQSRTNCQTTETSFRDGSVDNPLRTEAVQQTSCYFVTIKPPGMSVKGDPP